MEKIAVGYLRASDESQEDSVVQQRIVIGKWAEEHDFEIVAWYEDDGKSGTRFETRPGFMQMARLVESGRANFHYVIVWNESRWGRGAARRDNVGWKWHFSRFGVEIIMVKTSSKTGDDVADDMLECLEVNEARKYSMNLGEATKRGQIFGAQQGWFNGGTAPYGLVRIAVDRSTGIRTRVLRPGEHINQETEKAKLDLGDPLEVEIVKRIFREKIKGLGDREIADRLNRDSVPPPKSGRRRNIDGRWSAGSVRAILKNRAYTGTLTFNVHPQSHLKGLEKPVWINSPDQWIIKENAHPAIVSKEEYELANKNRQAYQRKNRYTDDSVYLLTGLIKCSHCGCKFYGQNQKQKSVRFYEDSGYISRGRSTCSSFKINKEKLESFVVKSTRTKILNSDLPLRLEKMLNENIKNRSVERLQDVEQYEKSLSEVRIRMERLLTLVENGAAIEELIDRIKEAEKEKKRIEQKLDELKLSNLSRKEIVEAKKEVQYLMENFETILKTAPIPVQKELIRKFVHSIIVDRETSSVVVYLKAIPTLKTEVNTTSTCIKVEKKWNKKVKEQSADRLQTEASIIETNQTSETTETPETNESVFAQNQ
jgi:DNA invertase Pin-like site-specific DNA recombinase